MKDKSTDTTGFLRSVCHVWALRPHGMRFAASAFANTEGRSLAPSLARCLQLRVVPLLPLCRAVHSRAAHTAKNRAVLGNMAWTANEQQHASSGDGRQRMPQWQAQETQRQRQLQRDRWSATRDFSCAAECTSADLQSRLRRAHSPRWRGGPASRAPSVPRVPANDARW